MRLAVVSALMLAGAAAPALAKECRIPHLPPGMEVRVPPGCEEPLPTKRAQADKREALKEDQGFIDLGNGTQLRIGGRVRSEMGWIR